MINTTDDTLIYEINNPHKSCKHCHGRGIIGWKLDGTSILCTCLQKPSKYGFITKGDYIKLLTSRRPK